MLERLGRCIFRRRWAVVIAWLCIFAGASIFAPRVTQVLKPGGYSIGKSESVVAYNDLHRAYGYRDLTFSVVFTGPPGARAKIHSDAVAFRCRASARFGAALAVTPPVWSPDGVVAIERVYSNPRDDFGAGFAGPLRAMLPHGSVRGALTGPSAIFHDMETISGEDLRRVEIVTLPIAAIVLLLIFGSVVASGTPVLMAPVTVTLALAAVYFVGHRVDMSIFVLNTASMLGLGVAIDYSLFMVHRFRQELELGRDVETAVAHTVATSGRAILVSAMVVTVGFYALTLSGVQMLRSLGIGGSIVTAVSLLVALTLMPAVLAFLGPRINLLPVVPRRLSTRRLWRKHSLWVMQRPIPIIGVVATIILVLGLPAFHLRVGIPGPQTLPASVDSRYGNDLLDRHLGYANQSPVLVVVKRDAGTPPSSYQSAAFTLLDRVCSSKEVAGIAPVPVPDSPGQIRSCQDLLTASQNVLSRQGAQARAFARGHHVYLLPVFLRTDPSSAEAERYVRMLRREPPIKGYTILIGGQTAGQMDFDSFLYSRFPWVIFFVIVTIFVVLLVAFRSLLLPLKAVVMNIFSVLAAYGVVVFAFQDAHMARLLGFTPVGNIDSIVPVFLFCVLFGISTDYEVFLLTRVQEQYLITGDNEESVATGLEFTGRIITSAALVMIVVFGAFSFASLAVIQEIGLGLAVAVLVDATLIRALLVPAVMRLLGRWNWWLPIRGFPPIRRRPAKTATATSRSPAAE
ncbi:MAG: MMPL family transporter [Chloroflexota bacterium]|nr:MAG: hypothetical protein DLM70_11425 [Chloroflexota bacterium]